MYHIPKDKRSYHSAALICEGLSAMLREKSYEDINVTNVCAPQGIARTTFYRLFDTLDDVLLYQFDALFEESIRQYSRTSEPYTQIILRIAMQKQPLISAIISSGRNDLFDFSTRTKQGAMIQNLQLDISEADWCYCISMMNNMIYGVLETWIRGGCRQSADELYKIMKRNISVISENI